MTCAQMKRKTTKRSQQKTSKSFRFGELTPFFNWSNSFSHGFYLISRDENCTNSTTEQDKPIQSGQELEKVKDIDDSNNNNNNSSFETETLDNNPKIVDDDGGCNNNSVENICCQEVENGDKVPDVWLVLSHLHHKNGIIKHNFFVC